MYSRASQSYQILKIFNKELPVHNGAIPVKE